jgi:dynein heavy chain
MRELSRTFQGVFKGDPTSLLKSNEYFKIDPEVYIMLLWKHEATRVFCDKLRDVNDINNCKALIDEILADKMPSQMDIISKDYLFCDYLRPSTEEELYPKVYELVKNIEDLRKTSEEFQSQLNQIPKLKGVNLVLFDDCLKYLIKLTRLFMTKQGSVMLVGVGGSGKQSLTRLASFICQHSVKQLNANNADNVDNLKALYREMYNDMIKDYNPNVKKFINRQTFLMTDAELRLDSFLETVSSFLATGEIANLYPKKDDKNEILSLARSMLIKMNSNNQDIDENLVWTYFIAIVRDDLHMSLCLSPSSESFRQKYIKFPILFNNCTMVPTLA